MLDELDSAYGYFCIEIDSSGCWSSNRDSVEIKYSESNRVMVSIIYSGRAKMYFLERSIVEEFIIKTLTIALTPNLPSPLYGRVRIRARLRWGSLSIAGFSVSGRADESDLRAQESALAEIVETFAKACELNQFKTEIA